MNLFRPMDDLLKRPESAEAAQPLALLTGAICCYALYGLATGFFQGGWSLAVAAAKVPLIILGSIAVCLPSLYVFSGLAGVDLSPRGFLSAVAGFAAITGLILLALVPVIWLFSVSTLSLGFLVWLHLFVWITALVFGRRFLAQSKQLTRGPIGLWLMLLFVVSLQVTTYLRPLLWREVGNPLLESQKKSFVEHLYDTMEWDH